MATATEEVEKKVIGIQMIGSQLDRFLEQKRRRNLYADAEAARQLLFERIEQLEREQAAEAERAA